MKKQLVGRVEYNADEVRKQVPGLLAGSAHEPCEVGGQPYGPPRKTADGNRIDFRGSAGAGQRADWLPLAATVAVLQL